jgi:hypothetical protein
MAAGNTYSQIFSTTVGTSTSSVVFSDIPQIYTDLVAIVTPTQGGDLWFQLNTDTSGSSTNYSSTWIYGSTPGSTRDSNTYRIYMNWSSNGGNYVGIIHFNNYSNTTTNKTALIRNGMNGASVDFGVGLWRNTAAINTITFKGTNNYGVGSILSLYGIKAA